MPIPTCLRHSRADHASGLAMAAEEVEPPDHRYRSNADERHPAEMATIRSISLYGLSDVIMDVSNWRGTIYFARQQACAIASATSVCRAA